MDIEQILKEMTAEEKAALVSGTDQFYTNPIPRLGVPALSMADGPHGLRKQTAKGNDGLSESEPSTSFPTAACTASGWDPENLRKMGEAIGEECRHYGVHTLLGPGVNLKRNPLCGRNFEYFSEDPLLAGVLGAAMVEGVQSKGVGVSVKHFALNNSENYRFMGNSVVSEKTARNLYLKAFEYIVKHAKPATVMCAYNRINGVFCSENRWLLKEVLRGEWGFDGVVMTDWGAAHDRVAGLKAGLDLEMPGDTAICRRWILDGLEDGSLPAEDLDEACRNILRWIDRVVVPASDGKVDWEGHHALAAEIAEDCAVLMKNGGSLPLGRHEKLHIEGELFSSMRYQGSGSSMIRPTRVTTPKDAFEANGVENCDIGSCDKILVFAGLTDEYESEGWDREHMRLPQDHLDLIDRMCETGKPVVVILFGGSPVELPFFDKVDAVLNMYLPGQNGGTAAYRLLFGLSNPSGKLAETWPVRYEDVPGHETFGKGITEIYSEGSKMGYRYYNAEKIPVRCPFGFGLSYTTFSRTEWEKDGEAYTATVANTGSRRGAEVVQLYLDGELRGFQKVRLDPGESVTVRIVPEPEDPVEYPDTLEVPEEPAAFPVTLESRFTDLRQTFTGRVLYRFVMGAVSKQAKKAEKLPDGPEKDNRRKSALFLKRILESSSPRSMTMSSGGALQYNIAEGFVEVANGHLFRGLKCFMKKIRVPKLPKDMN